MTEQRSPRPVPGPPRPVPGPPPSPAHTSSAAPSSSADGDAEDDRFADLDEQPVADHVAVFEAEHSRLQRELGTIDQL
jgi:hypothetical protein